MTTISTGNVGLNAVQVAAYQWSFGPIAAVTIAGAIEIRHRGRADIYTDLYEERCALYVVESDGVTVRGTMYAATSALGTDEDTEWSTSFANYTNTITAGNVTDVAAQDGDYIVIEIGADHDAALSNDGFDIEIGDTSSSNHMYVEFTETITGGVEPTTLSYDYADSAQLQMLINQSGPTHTPTTDGVGSLAYTVNAGALPTGLSLDAATGIISGTPTARGSYSATIRVTNSLGDADATLSWRVGSLGAGRGNFSMRV